MTFDIHFSDSYAAFSKAAARSVTSWIRHKPNSLVCIASGESTVGICQEIVKKYHKGHFDIDQVTFIGLDEWVGMDQYDEGSCKSYLYEHLFNQLPLVPEQIQYFDAKAPNLLAECERINNLIADNGGLDVMLVGIGLNGHIALNEPGTPFDTYAHVTVLDKMTIEVGQKYFKKETPLTQGITLGLQHLQDARRPILVASGLKKADVIRKALKGPIDPHFPASIFQKIPYAKIFLDKESASELKMRGK